MEKGVSFNAVWLSVWMYPSLAPERLDWFNSFSANYEFIRHRSVPREQQYSISKK
jgi:hypothetical protein